MGISLVGAQICVCFSVCLFVPNLNVARANPAWLYIATKSFYAGAATWPKYLRVFDTFFDANFGLQLVLTSAVVSSGSDILVINLSNWSWRINWCEVCAVCEVRVWNWVNSNYESETFTKTPSTPQPLHLGRWNTKVENSMSQINRVQEHGWSMISCKESIEKTYFTLKETRLYWSPSPPSRTSD